MEKFPPEKKSHKASRLSIGLIGLGREIVDRKLRAPQTVYILLIGLLASFVWSAYNLKALSTEYSFKQFYPENHKILEMDREVKKTFQINERSPFLYIVELPSHQIWLEKSRIRKLQNLTKKFSEIEGVQQAVTMTSIEGAAMSKNEIVIGNFFDRVPEKLWKKEAPANSLIYPIFLSRDFRTSIIAVYTEQTSAQQLKKWDQQFRSQIQKFFPQAQITSAGVPVMQTQLTELIRSELSVFFVVALVVFCLLFFALFSHWSAVVAAFLVLLVSQVFSLGILIPLKVPMNVILSTLPIIVSVSVMSLLIHTFHLWSIRRSELNDFSFPSRWSASLDTLKDLALPNFLGALTTAFGFLALFPSEIPIIKQYGWVVSLIVALIAIFGQALVLVTLPFVEPKMRRWFDRPALWAIFSVRHAKPIFVGVLFVTLISLFGVPALNFSGKLFTDLPQKNIAQTTTQKLDEKNGGLVTYDLVLEASEEGFFKQVLNLQKLDSLTHHLRQESAVGSVVALPDLFQGQLPSNQNSLAESLFLFTMAEKNPLLGFLTEDARKTRLMVRFSDQTGATIFQLRSWVKDSVKAYFPAIKVSESGMAVANHSINQMVAKDLVFSFWHPLILIGLFLVVIFKSFRWAVIACVPNLVPPVVLIGAMALSGVVIKPGVALVFAIALGFAFNNTIYLLSRLKKKMNLVETLKIEANPCAFESVVMFAGFSVFALSQFSVNKMFGVFMMVSIVFGFIGDLMFLPALLTLFPKILRAQTEESQSSYDLAKVAAVLGTICLIAIPQKSFALSATEILKKSQQQLESKDDQSRVEIKIIEKNGEEKIRKLNLKTRRGSHFSVIAKIQSPVDVKGMGFLGQVKDGEESQWIYLPSTKQVRRVVTGKTKGGLLGSEISSEDLNTQAVKSSKARLLATDAQGFQIEVSPKKGTSSYSKVVSHISKENFLPQRADYYVGNKIKKSVEFSGYQKIGNVFRAQKISVKNLFNGRKTEVIFSDLKVNSGLSESDFTQNALKTMN